MTNTLNILCVENVLDDYELILIVLKKAEIKVFSKRVENAVDFKKALDSNVKWDVILSDYVMPSFNGLEALNIYKASRLNIPFIVVSGSITDIEAVAILKAGANDYVSKEKLLRLPSAILREIKQAKIRQELKESENRWKIALEGTTDGLWDINLKTNKVFYSKEWKAMLGYKDHEVENKVASWEDLVHPEDLARVEAHSQEHINNNTPSFYNEYRMRCKDGSYKWILDRGKIVERTKEGEPLRMMGIHSDIDARKKLEEELIKAQEIAQLGSFNLNLKTKEATTSFIFDKITGFNVKDTKDFKMWRELVYPDDVNANQKMLENCIKTGGAWEREYRIIKAGTKEIKWLYGKGEIHYEKNVATHFVGIIQDITKRKRNEFTNQIIYKITKKAGTGNNLAKLFNYIKVELAKLIDTSNFFIALYNEETDIISTPYMVDEQDDGSDFPKGKTLTGYLIDHKKPILANHDDLLKLKKEKKIAILGPLSQCWLGVPLIIENKAIGAIVVQSYKNEKAYTNEDISLLELIAVNISQAIKQSLDFEQIRLLSHALTQSPESVVVTDINGNIEYVNPAFTALSGYTPKEVIGKNPRILKTEHQDKAFYKELWETILSGKVWKGELTNKRKDDTLYIVQANISAVKNKEGIITNFVAVEEDITEKRKLERDFLHAFIDAQEVEKQSFGEELHDGVSQILSAQGMFIDVLKTLTKNDTGKISEHLSNVKELNTKAINETRTIAHGLMSKQLKEEGLILAVAQICKDYNTSRDTKFTFSCNNLLEDEISKDIKTNVFRIIQEVTTNTVRHSLATKSKIKMTKTTNNQLKIVLKDNGVGIDFERNKVNNKGAGLENIKRRISLLNGDVDLKSELDVGTQYTLHIPLDFTG